MGNQEIAPPQKSQQRPPGHRENIVPLQPAPDRLQPLHALERGIAGIEGAVQRADAGADHHVGGDAVARRANAACRPGWRQSCRRPRTQRRFSRGPIWSIRTRRARSHHRRVGDQAARRSGVVIAAGERGAATHSCRHARRDPQDHGRANHVVLFQVRNCASRSMLATSVPAVDGTTTLSARRTPSRSRNGRACCGCLRRSRAASNICFSSSSIAGLPHIMMRSVSMSSGAWPISLNNCSDVIRSVMRPRLRNGSRVTVG